MRSPTRDTFRAAQWAWEQTEDPKYTEDEPQHAEPDFEPEHVEDEPEDDFIP